jgi:predicted DNA-binding protein
MKTGRPRADNPKNCRFSIRLDATTEKALSDYCKRTNQTKGEVIRQVLEKTLNVINTEK